MLRRSTAVEEGSATHTYTMFATHTLALSSLLLISILLRIEGENIGRARETVRGFASRRREQSLERATTTTEAPSDSNRCVVSLLLHDAPTNQSSCKAIM